MNFTIKTKVIVATVAGIILLMAVVIFFNLRDHKNALAESFRSMKKDVNETTLSMISQRISLLKSDLEIIANNEEANKMFKDGNRDGLYKRFEKLFKRFKQDYDIEQMQYITKDSVAFLRYHDPSKYGDDLSGFRATVVEANRSQKVVSGIEVGRGGLGLRVVYPVFLNGEHIGVVEMGSGLDGILSTVIKKL